MQIDTVGSSADTALAIYRGTALQELVELASDDNSAPDGVRSSLSMRVTKNTIYLAAVDTFQAEQGIIKAKRSLTPNDSLAIQRQSALVRITGFSAGSATLEQSSNLADWLPLAGSTISGGQFDFEVPGNFGRRFYRLTRRSA